MDAVDALNEIAYWLERELASSCRTKAFSARGTRPQRRDPPDNLLKIALDAGCLFSIDSDAHAPGRLGFVELGAARAEAAGIPADRIVTTWELSKLSRWLSRP